MCLDSTGCEDQASYIGSEDTVCDWRAPFSTLHTNSPRHAPTRIRQAAPEYKYWSLCEEGTYRRSDMFDEDHSEV